MSMFSFLFFNMQTVAIGTPPTQVQPYIKIQKKKDDDIRMTWSRRDVYATNRYILIMKACDNLYIYD